MPPGKDFTTDGPVIQMDDPMNYPETRNASTFLKSKRRCERC